jgi:GntR family transcriptional regulator
MQQINKSLKIPLYHQLYEILRESITTGEWKPGDMIPPETELMVKFEVSRTTIRDVMDKLVNEGLIFRQQGRGSFVSQPTMEQGLVRITNFTDDMHQRGLTASSNVLSAELIPASEEIAQKLNINVGEELGLLRRLRLGNNEPMSVEESFFIHKYAPGYLTRHDYSTTSLRDSLVADYHIHWLRARQIVRAISSPREMSKFLQIPHHAPLLFVERITTSDQDIPVEYLRVFYRGDRYSLFSELHS